MKVKPGDKVVIDNNSKYIYTVINVFEASGGEKRATIYCEKLSTSMSWPVNSTRMKKYKEEVNGPNLQE